MLGDIFKDEYGFTYTYYKKLSENHRMFCSEQAEVVDVTDEAFKKLSLYKPYISIIENKDAVVLGGVSYVKFMESIKSFDETSYNELKEFKDPFEFRDKLENCLESVRDDDTKYRAFYAGLFIYESLDSLVDRKSNEINHITITEDTLSNTESATIKESLMKELEDSNERMVLISKAFCFI